MVWIVMVLAIVAVVLAIALYYVHKKWRVLQCGSAAYRRRKRRQVDYLKSKLRDINLALGGVCIYQRLAENQRLAEQVMLQKATLFDDDKFRQGLHLNQKLLVRICNIMEFPEPGQRKTGSYTEVVFDDEFWMAFRDKDWPTLRAWQQRSKNKNRCSVCLNCGTLHSDARIKGICGGCGAVGPVFDPVAIAMVQESMRLNAESEALWPEMDTE